MAKTLAELFTRPEQSLAKARQNYQWTQTELHELPVYEQKRVDSKVSRKAESLNKKLAKAAFVACDKEEYAENELQTKLAAFDIKQQMAYRAAYHAAAKQIFADKLSQEEILSKMFDNITAIKDKRAQYVAKLNERKTEFLAKHSVTNNDEYAAKRNECEQILASCKVEAEKQRDKRVSDKTAKLNKKLAKYQAQVDKYRTAIEQGDKSLTDKIKKFDKKITACQAQVEKCNATKEQSNKVEKLNKKIAAYQAQIYKCKTAIERGNVELPDDVLLRVKNLKMYFGGLKAVDDLTFDVKKGEIFGLIGPNGAGKTTVFNCITRFYDATDGEIYFVNKHDEVVDMHRFKVHDVILQGITRTFQNVELVREISVLENLLVACTREYRSNLAVQALGLPVLKREERILRQKAMDVLKFMGLESYANWLAFGLPYGILKKVEIARALMSNAKLIIMDEPAAGLNDSETAELTETIKRIRDEFNVTILLVEHDMSLVMNVCDTVCAISFGKMLAIGTREEIQCNKAVQEAYLGVEEDGK